MSSRRLAFSAVASAVFALVTGASGARPAAPAGQVTITMLGGPLVQPAYDVLIANFERVYPNITVNVTYAASSALGTQLELTELASGSAPDLLPVTAGGCMDASVCALAQAGDLAPMIDKPWAKRSIPLVTSLAKYGKALYAFVPTVAPEGVFTNDALFEKFRLKVPQTFSQLLVLCRRAKADGTAAVVMDGASTTGMALLLENLAIAPVFGQDPRWNADLKNGKASFEGAPGWHQALQEFVEMNDTGCFQPGVAGTSLAAEETEFAQGQGLMAPAPVTAKGVIGAAGASFAYSFHQFPGGTTPIVTTTYVGTSNAVGVNSHSDPAHQAAAQMFIDFIARPKQDALFAQLTGGLTQYQFLHDQLPPYMATLGPAFQSHHYVVGVSTTWPAGVSSVLAQQGIGLITGQATADGILTAMDAAWKQGPS